MDPIWVPLLLAAVLLHLPPPAAPLHPPSPGNFPSTRYRTLRFPDGFANRWGPEHQRVDRTSVAIWLDSTSGSGFKSHRAYRLGYFGAAVKLQGGYTAGVITAFYLSNNEAYPGHHDEVDMEFLGTTLGQPYTLQTNVYVRGSGDGRIIGREMKFHLWFDPTQAFHHYAILWTPTQIIFLVDDVPIRRYRRKGTTTFPEREMWVYGSIWDASAWATDNGKYHADYRYQPFVARFARLQAGAAAAGAARLSFQQRRAMAWVHRHSLVYNYCRDPKRDHSLTPECRP